MSTEPPDPSQPGGPQPPPRGASREEWRDWRRQRRFYHGPWGWNWWGSAFWGLLFVAAGAYFLLKNLGLLDWVRGDVFWPVVLILLGLWMILGRAMRYRG